MVSTLTGSFILKHFLYASSWERNCSHSTKEFIEWRMAVNIYTEFRAIKKMPAWEATERNALILPRSKTSYTSRKRYKQAILPGKYFESLSWKSLPKV